MPATPLSCLGALAVELRPGATASRSVIERELAGQLAGLAARDLAGFAPAAERLDFVLAAGLFDPVELLRPGWPLHAELERLLAQAPGHGPRVMGLGAAAGVVAPSLQPHPDFVGGPLRLLPWLLRGEAADVGAVGGRLEDGLLEAGMAAADTALLVQDAFGVAVEHVRYLTVHDLAAMMALQYQHAGLAPLWPLLEAALLAPSDEVWLDAAPEPLIRYRDGQARIALFDLDAWAEGGFGDAHLDASRLSRAFDHFQHRQRQFAAVLEAHGVQVTYDHCPSGRDPRGILAA